MIHWSAVEIRDQHEAALRAYLLDGPEAWVPLQDELTVAQAAAPYVQLVQAAFAVAVKRRFSPTYNVEQVIRFVADVRLELIENEEDVNPRIAERLVRMSLGDPGLPERTAAPEDGQDVQQETAARVAMLFFLVADAQPDEAWLDGVVRESGEVARRWLVALRAEEAAKQSPAG